MADFVELDPGSGGSLVYVDELTVATSTLVAQRVKIELGADGVDDGPVNSSNPLPITLVSSEVSVGGGTQYVDGNTSTSPTGTVMLWKSAVSTLVPPSTSNPLPITTIGALTVSSVDLQALSTYAASTNSLISTLALTNSTRLSNISTFTNSTNTLLVNLSSNSASSIALESTIAQRLTLVSSLALQATLAQVTTYTKSTADMIGGSVGASSGAFWVQSVPGSAQTTISTTDLIRVAIYGTSDNQITSFGSGTQYAEGQTTTAPTGTVMLWKAAVSTLQAVATSQPLPVHFISTSVSIGGGTQYVEGNTTTAPTGNVLIWKSAVSTMSAASTSNPLPVHFISTSVAIGGGTQYVDGNTTTLPTGNVMLWKSAVSTIVPASTSNPLPITTIGAMTVSSVDLQALTTYALSTNTLLVQISSNTASSNALVSTQGVTLGNISTFTNSTNTLAIQISSNTASTNALLSTHMLTASTRFNNISTFTNSSNTLLIQVSSNTASTNALLSTAQVTYGNISTFTNSTNTLLVQVSSNTASSNALLSTISARLAPVPTGIYVQPVPVSSNGLTPYLTLDCNNSTQQVVSTAATIYGIYFGNTSTKAAYLKIWDGVSSATFVSSTAATMCIPVPGNANDVIAGNFNAGNGIGIKMSTGICIAGVFGANNGNSTQIGISTLVVNLLYKA